MSNPRPLAKPSQLNAQVPTAVPTGLALHGSALHGPAALASGAEGAGGAAVDAAALSVGLVTLNARWVHLALSLRCLRNAAREAGFANTWLREYTITTPQWKVAAELLALRPRVLGFSVYIWNRRETLELCERLKKADPSLRIVLGGPEVSFEPEPPSPTHLPYVDAVIAGEGELKWVHYLRTVLGQAADGAAALGTLPPTALPPLERLPYRDEDLAPEAQLAHRLVYMEASRGCPYTCSFCLSALDEQVRFYPDAAVRETLERLIAAGARRIKFLDRTFNLGRKRVLSLLTWLMQFRGVEFHFEVVGDLLDEETLLLLEGAPAGMFQFEIGVQTTGEEALNRIRRHRRMERLLGIVARLRAAGRVHLHLDLIWGLPGEGLAEMRRSFEQVVALWPHELQLGFLKFLPGAPIRTEIEPCGYVYQDQPPYEVISHNSLSAAELLFLKRFAEVFEQFHNRARFQFTLRRLCAALGAWEVFAGLAEHMLEHGLLVREHSLDALAQHLLEWAGSRGDGGPEAPGRAELTDLMRLDYAYRRRVRRLPAVLRGEPVAETPAVRERRRKHPQALLLAFHHQISIDLPTAGMAQLRPSPEPVWYAFDYGSPHASPEGKESGADRGPENGTASASEGYFSHATLEALP